ncbi:FAD-binding protein [Candidatus Woesearchaeota archaeon]|nr:FAD-binding protein [Candidatus Woesearchaeota archaeon]
MDPYTEFAQKKQLLSKRVRQSTSPVMLGKATSNLFRHRGDAGKKIDVRQFTRVLKIDKENGVCDVEGMTTYERLVDATLAHGMMPTVVPELKSITIGGAIAGLGIESSSFRYGLVHETVLELEILLPSGKIVIATPTNKHKDLFFGFPNSYGTLGYVLRCKVKIVPVKPFVKLWHTKCTDVDSYFENLESVCRTNRQKGADFIDGTLFSPGHAVITIAEMKDSAPYTSDYNGMNIYYKSLQSKKTDYLTIRDYIWRWDTDWFWCSSHFFVQNRIIRALIPRRFLRSTTYWTVRKWVHKIRILDWLSTLLGKRSESVIQDVEIPLNNCAEFAEFLFDRINIRPVWICPLRPQKLSFSLYPMQKKWYVNFGFWDTVPSTKPRGFYNRLVERKVAKLDGMKSLYSSVHYSKKEFWQLYNGKKYAALKKKYDPKRRGGDLFEKCTK